MTLVELAEPLFLYVGTLLRSAQKGALLEVEDVRRDILATFADMRVKAESHPHLAYQYDRKMYLTLLFFVDFMIKESNLPFAPVWEELAFEENELAGDEQFFDLLEETLAQNTEVSMQQLAVFRECLRLGFTGCYSDDWKYIRQKHTEIDQKLRGEHTSITGKVSPAAYEHGDFRPLRQRPLRSFLLLRLGLIGLVLLMVVVNVGLYIRSSGGLRESLIQINRITLEQAERQVNSALPAQE